jgi:hypothetical protein
MNRHHPYGGGYDGPSPRRGGSPIGPGPDRSHRFAHERGGGANRGRGFGRGRGGGGGGGGGGGYGNFDTNYTGYDQGIPQGDNGAFNYDNNLSQDSYYQNGNYPSGAPAHGQYGTPGPSDAFNQGNQGFGNFEGALEY